MRRRQDAGIWEIFLPELGVGSAYKYEIVGPDGKVLPLKADPFAFRSEFRPATASIVAAVPAHDWGDESHRASWERGDPRREAIRSEKLRVGKECVSKCRSRGGT